MSSDKKIIGRPRGTKSKNNILKYNTESKVIKDWSILSNKAICKKYNISIGQLRNIRIRNKLKSKSISYLLYNRVKLEDTQNKIGVYAIVRSDGKKVYIGHSTDIYKRIKSHMRELNKGTHHLKDLQSDFNEVGMYICIYKEYDKHSIDIQQEENSIIDSLDSSVIYNKCIVNYINVEDAKYIFSLCLPKIQKNNSNECWEWTGSKNKGYGMKCYKSITYPVHRLSYISHNETVPMIIAHKCNNKLCCNPSHLEEQSVRDNLIYYYDTNVKRPAKKPYPSKMDPYQNEVKDLINSGMKYSKIIRSLNLNTSHSNFCRYIKKMGFV